MPHILLKTSRSINKLIYLILPILVNHCIVVFYVVARIEAVAVFAPSMSIHFVVPNRH